MTTNVIYYEDCITNLSKRIKDDSIDLIIADPPFGIKFDGKGTQYNRKSEFVVSGDEEIEHIKTPNVWVAAVSEIENFLLLEEVVKVVAPNVSDY